MKHTKGFFVEIFGLVQGVGFRPFVYNAALKFALKGEVLNDGEGVKIWVVGEECEAFLKHLREFAPPLARIDSLKATPLDTQQIEYFSKSDKFSIASSQQNAKYVPILPDFAICDACQREFFDPADRRYHHLFINCTNCGPRLSIITALPYDRKNTTMNEFAMCRQCAAQYADPADRRYHAQPIACKSCGPVATLRSLDGAILARDYEAVRACAELVDAGETVAVKGLGGFHLVCDATSQTAVLRLRAHKNRPHKPFAVMAKDAETAQLLGEFDTHELNTLTSKERPIVLVRKKNANTNAANLVFSNLCETTNVAENAAENVAEFEKTQIHKTKNSHKNASTNVQTQTQIHETKETKTTNFTELEFTKSPANAQTQIHKTATTQICKVENETPKHTPHLCEAVAPNLNEVGIFLPPTALHLAFFENLRTPAVVATSANISGEPILTNFESVAQKFGGFLSAVLDFDRKIVNASDDSLVFCESGRQIYVRTSRGVKPHVVRVGEKKGCFLALGSEMKNTFAIYKDGVVITSPYIGDLKNVAVWERFFSQIENFRTAYELKFDFVVGDLHPNFALTKEFERRGFVVKRLAHHKAHIFSVAFENGLLGEDGKFGRGFLGLSWDGTGYGEDGKIWGGEVFLGEGGAAELSRLLHFCEFGLVGGDNAVKHPYKTAFSLLKHAGFSVAEAATRLGLGESEAALLWRAEALGVRTTSVGRIFDGFASLATGLKVASFDAQAPMMLGAFYDDGLDYAYDFSVLKNEISFAEAVVRAARDDARHVATGLVNGLANLACSLGERFGLPLVLSGGVFQNRALLRRIFSLCGERGGEVFVSKKMSANDENIALGQLAWAIRNAKCRMRS